MDKKVKIGEIEKVWKEGVITCVKWSPLSLHSLRGTWETSWLLVTLSKFEPAISRSITVCDRFVCDNSLKVLASDYFSYIFSFNNNIASLSRRSFLLLFVIISHIFSYQHVSTLVTNPQAKPISLETQTYKTL